jgi:BA14K-like protein
MNVLFMPGSERMRESRTMPDESSPSPGVMKGTAHMRVSNRTSPARAARNGLAALLAAAVALPLAQSGASANDIEIFEDDAGAHYGNQHFQQGGPSFQRIRRDHVGRYFVRNGHRIYIQYWDHEENPVFHDHGGTIHDGDWDADNVPVNSPVRKKRNKDVEAAIIAGIAGLAVGALVGAVQQPTRPVIAQPVQLLNRPQLSNAYPPRPAAGPHVVTVGNAFEPWTPAWSDWCRSRYRSFNPASGTFTGYDGVKRFCVVK